MTNWYYYPFCDEPTEIVKKVVEVFEDDPSEIDLATLSEQVNNLVLDKVAIQFQQLGLQVETGKRRYQEIRVPVLFDQRGTVAKSFEAYAYFTGEVFVIEV